MSWVEDWGIDVFDPDGLESYSEPDYQQYKGVKMEATIKALNKMGTGVIFEGEENWTNVPRNGEPLFKGLNRGDVIKFEKNDEGYVIKVEKTGSKPAPAKKEYKGGGSSPRPVLPENARQTAVNAVMGSTWAHDKNVDTMENYETAKSIMVDLEQYILTGKFPGGK